MRVVALTIGSRGRKSLKKLMRRITCYDIKYCATDEWKVYRAAIQKSSHLVGTRYTTHAESISANVWHYLARFRRRTRCYSKCPVMVKLSLLLLFRGHLLNEGCTE